MSAQPISAPVPPHSFDACYLTTQAIKMRMDIVKMLACAGSGHPGGSLSAVDLMAVLYFGGVMRYDVQNPCHPGRDRFILSKGHAAPVLYAALARAGYFSAKEFKTLRHLGSMLQGHPDAELCPGVEVSTGSLGQGLSIAAGLAQGLRLQAAGARNDQVDNAGGMDGTLPQIYTLLGDGELQEGQNWEAALYAAHYKLGNVVAIVDRNFLQIDGNTEDVMALGDVGAKFAAFGWEVATVDGHDFAAIYETLTKERPVDKPYVIVANTTKGKGVSFMEDVAGWHGVAPNDEQCDAACAELQVKLSLSANTQTGGGADA